MADSLPCHFTCTLSEALQFNRSKGARQEQTPHGVITKNEHYEDVNGFVKFLAKNHGNKLAFGSAVLPSISSRGRCQQEHELLTFEDIYGLSRHVASYFKLELTSATSASGWVALFAGSSTIFLLVWLGLIRAGLKVLLLACSSVESVQHLLRLCGTEILIHDLQHRKVADSIRFAFHQPNTSNASRPDQVYQRPKCYQIPWTTLHDIRTLQSAGKTQPDDDVDVPSCKATDIVYSFHSSGTTGRPKLIPQTHHGAVGILPLLQTSHDSQSHIPATLTTTPLYSGGVADVFRSWSAATPLWLFPETQAPITTNNVRACIETIDKLSHLPCAFPEFQLQYVSCVPFVLEAMVEHPELVGRLCEMKMIGVGGASMPKALGDELVAQGIRLVSRFGSSENGFLLSSDRDFDIDKSWDVLRYRGEPALEFKQLNGHSKHFELVVPPEWPLVCIASHAARPFNTHDLFAQHAGNADEWHYKGRTDAQLTLNTGKKFDPSELEDLLCAHNEVANAIVVGDGQSVPALLIFLAQNSEASHAAKQEQVIYERVEQENQKIPKHARIDKKCIRILPYSKLQRIRKNNKGGIIRSSVEDEFSAEITQIYNGSGESREFTDMDFTSLGSIMASVRTIVTARLDSADEVNNNDDLFAAGLDSQGCIFISQSIKHLAGIKVLLPGKIYECGTIRALAEHIAEVLQIDTGLRVQGTCVTHRDKEMLQMVDEHVNIQPKLLATIDADVSRQALREAVVENDQKVFLLTGSTGFLGIHILKTLLEDACVSHVFILIRGSRNTTNEAQKKSAKARIVGALSYHRLDNAQIREQLEIKGFLVPYFLKDDDLGIKEAERHQITASVTHIVHAAWEVNFNLPLRSFTSHIRGTVSLFNFALLASRERKRNTTFVYCSSLASIQDASAEQGQLLENNVSDNPLHSSKLGYGQSKWVTEQTLSQLQLQCSAIKIALLRVGQLSGDTIHGIWNRREAWPLMIDASLNAIRSTSSTTGNEVPATKICTFPDLASTTSPPLYWLPVNRAAEDILAVANEDDQTNGCCIVKSISSNCEYPSWGDMQEFVKRWAADRDYTFTLVSASKWLDDLDASQTHHPAKALLSLWRENWKNVERKTSAGQDKKPNASDEVSDSCGSKPAPDNPHIDEVYVRKLLSWVAAGH